MGPYRYYETSNYKTLKAWKRVTRRRNPVSNNFDRLSRASSHSEFEREKNDIITIKLPQIFSIWKDPEKALKVFEKTEKFLKKGKSIFLDMANIEQLTEDAILYLISRLNFYRITYQSQKVQGIFPKDTRCRDFLVRSHFPKFVYTDVKCEDTQEIFPIKDGILADGTTVSQMIDFVKNYLNLDETNSQIIYGTILECLKNTREHAYADNYEGRWWMIAIPSPNKKVIHFTTLDNGYGIPSTVRKKFTEIIKDRSVYLGSNKIDAELICSALEGDYQRTSTNKDYRGKGLPTVFALTEVDQIANLRIISNFGHVLTDNNKNIKNKEILSSKFEGTLISWDFIEKNE